MSFLKFKPNMNHVVISEYNTQYTNKYYHSRFDNRENLGFQFNSQQQPPNDTACLHLGRMATLLARTLYKLSWGDNDTLPPNLEANCTLAELLTICFTQYLSCDLVAEYLPGYSFSDGLPSQYTSVHQATAVQQVTAALAREILYEYTASFRGGNCTTYKDCDNSTECIRHRCLKSGTYYHDALSLAFDQNLDGTYSPNRLYWETESTWTESNWGSLYLEIFMMDSLGSEIAVLVMGILEVLASIGAVFFVRNYLTKHFKAP